jgi:hypothetical protein
VAVAAAIAVALGACTYAGRPLRTWHLDGGGDVTLPSTLAFTLPSHEADFELRDDVALARDERGRELTIVFDCFHGPLALTLDGREITDTGDTSVGEHAYVVPAVLTERPMLALAIRAHWDRNVAFYGFGAAPRLAVGAANHPTATFERDASFAALGVALVFGVLFAMLYALDRRRTADGAFAVQALCAVVIMLQDLGTLSTTFGSLGFPIFGIAMIAVQLAQIAFLHLSFDLGPWPRRLIGAYIVTAVLYAIGARSFAVEGLAMVAAMALQIPLYVHFLLPMIRLTRTRTTRFDASLVLAAMLFGALEVNGYAIALSAGATWLHGVHLICLTVFVWGVAQALILARQHVARSRTLERTADELQRQVAERSKELAEALAKLSHQPPELVADRLVDGRYRVVRRLGAGGMGAVHEVERISDRERFALKRMRGKADADTLARFAREAQIAAELRHPNLVPVIDVGISDGALFLVMPVIAGGSLDHERARFGDAAWARPLLAQIAAGLAALHDRGIVHRDLKPGNVLIDRGVARIADFGLASMRTVAEDGGARSLGDIALAATGSPGDGVTRAGDVFGTPAYLAPELASGVREAPPSSDVFAFGVLAYEMLSGRAAFAVAPVLDRLAGRAIATPDPIAGPHGEIVLRCLALAPDGRPTARELVTAFSA